jgi:hypothetical protein
MTVATTPSNHRIDRATAQYHYSNGPEWLLTLGPVSRQIRRSRPMTVAQTPEGYAVTISAAERDQLLTATEYALSVLRDERDGARMLLDLDADHLDTLVDRLFLVSHPAA